MKFVITILLAGILAGCAFQKVESQKRGPEAKKSPALEASPLAAKQPVLVELFTSEGCSSCPPADRTLDFLDREQPYFQAEIIALAFHVDYWDRLGWKDPYSSPIFTQRQEFYSQKLRTASVYTPQMIVDGRTEFVGSNDGRAAEAIIDAAKSQKARIEIVRDGGMFRVAISDLPRHEKATLFLAIAENGLSSSVTAGENTGKKLAHRAVVRELRALGGVDSSENRAEFQAALVVPAEWRKPNLNVVVFCQENESRRILGVARAAFGG